MMLQSTNKIQSYKTAMVIEKPQTLEPLAIQEPKMATRIPIKPRRTTQLAKCTSKSNI